MFMNTYMHHTHIKEGRKERKRFPGLKMWLRPTVLAWYAKRVSFFPSTKISLKNVFNFLMLQHFNKVPYVVTPNNKIVLVIFF